MSFTFQFRRGPATEWTTDNPVLHNGEPGYEDDTGRLKMGDGVQAWNDLDYFPPLDELVSGVASVDGRTGVVTLADLYAAISHSHSQSQVTNLVDDLSGKASTSHNHDGSYSASGHNHTGVYSVVGHLHVAPAAPVALVDGANIATDASLSNYFRVTLGGNRTLDNPIGMVDGQRVLWEIAQDSAGNRTLALASAFIFGADITSITLSTAANKVDLLGAIYKASTGKWLVAAFTKGF